MNYDFEFKDDECTNSALVTLGRFKLGLFFENEAVTECLVETDKTKYEHGFDTNDLSGIYFEVDKKMVSLEGLIADVEKKYPDYVSDHEQYMIDEDRMRQELSSPYMTGRI